jgi:ribonuclease-3
MDNINTILSKYKIVPRNFSIYEQALTHSSFSQNNDIKNYERLEFLGDAIINKVVAEHLFKTRPD